MNGIGAALIIIVISYFVIKYAVKNGIIEAHKHINGQ